jgi:hypothetical protein
MTCKALRSSLYWDVTHCRLVVTDVSEKPISPISKAEAIQEECRKHFDCFTLEDGADGLSRNVGSETSNLRCITSQKS